MRVYAAHFLSVIRSVLFAKESPFFNGGSEISRRLLGKKLLRHEKNRQADVTSTEVDTFYIFFFH